jgi:ElaB/YqjD/DUF883 family membrane-anchored ribosome-binding protein
MKRQINPYDQVKDDATGAATTAIATIGDAAGEKLDEVRKNVEKNTRNMRQQADTFVRERPYQAIAVAVGIGALFGYLAGRRSTED